MKQCILARFLFTFVGLRLKKSILNAGLNLLNSTQKQMHNVKIALKQYKTPMKLQLI